MLTSDTKERPVLFALAFIACFFFAYFAHDIISLMQAHFIGWDFTLTCAGVDAYTDGLDPYYVKNLKNTTLSYSYLPFTLDMFRPICHNTFLSKHYRMLYPALALLCTVLLGAFSSSHRRMHDAALRTLFIFGGFAGFEWVFKTGNIAMFDGVLTALGLFFLFSGHRLQSQEPARSWYAYNLGSVILGFSTALKILYFPLLIGLYFVPVNRSRKVILIAVAVIAFAIPVASSYFFYHDLFLSWIDCALGHIPNQHSASTEECNTSVYCLAQIGLSDLGVGASKHILSILLYGMGITMILGAFAYQLIRIVVQQTAPGDRRPFLQRLDSLLLDHPTFAMRVAIVCMMAFFLCSFRLKEYGYFELALYAAVLVVDLPLGDLLLVFFASIAIPILSNQPVLEQGSLFFGGFDQLVVAVLCYAVLLVDLDASFALLSQNNRRLPLANGESRSL